MLSFRGALFGPFDRPGLLAPHYDYDPMDPESGSGGDPSTPSPPRCPEGFEWNEERQRCYSTTRTAVPRCEVGEYWHEGLQKCMPQGPTCPPGYKLDPNGSGGCIPDNPHDTHEPPGPDETTPTTPTTPHVPSVSGGPAPHPGTFTYNPFQTAPPQFDPLTLDPFSNPEIANLYFPGGPDVNAPVYDQFNAPTMADVEADPGYQFRRDEGLKAILNSQAARGMARGGSALKGMARWNQGHASEEYDRVYGRRLTEHGIGRTRALDQYGFELGAEQRGFRDFMQRHQADLGDWQRAFQTTAFNNSQAERVHLLNAGIGSDRWNRQFQVHQANQAGAAGAHNMNIYGFSSYMDPLLRLYGIQSGQNPTPSYFPIPMPQATY